MDIPLLLVGSCAGLAHSVYSALSKWLLRERVREPFLLLLHINLCQAILAPLIWLFVKPTLPPPEAWTSLLLAGGTCTVAYLFLYTSLSCGDASSVMPIMGSKVIFSGLLAILMLNERHRASVYLAALLVAVAIAALSYSPSAARPAKWPVKPMALMLMCSIVFAFTDIYIKRSLAFVDSYNFVVYYHFLFGIGSLVVIPRLRREKVPLALSGRALTLTLASAVFLLASTLLFVVAFRMAQGVVVPNVLMATRGVFIVVVSAVLARTGSTAIETQSPKVYVLRLAASSLIIVAVWIVLRA